MVTNLFDKNGTEIKISDKYKTTSPISEVYTVFFKGGCVCGGFSYEECEPLAWYSEDGDIRLQENLDWLEIIKE